MAYVIYVAYVLYIRDIRNIRNIKNIYCWGGPSGRGKRQENRSDGSLGGWGLLFQGGARANVGVLGGLWMLLTGVENFLCEKMFFGSFF